MEVRFETPDGMVRVYLPVVGKSAPSTLKSLSEYSDPKYGWEPDADYGSGVIGPSVEDLERWGKENEEVDLPRREEFTPAA